MRHVFVFSTVNMKEQKKQGHPLKVVGLQNVAFSKFAVDGGIHVVDKNISCKM